MQREVLSRSVICSDGMTYEAGTPIEQLPADNRESCSRSGWTRFEAVPSEDQSDETDHSDLEKQSDQTDQTDLVEQTTAEDETLTRSATEASDEGESKLLSDTSLEVRIVELLNGAGITTIAEAREYLAANKTFRTIKDIGKASDTAIRAVIEK